MESFQGQCVAVYRDAFSAPPYCKAEEEVIDFAQSLPQHLEREGFRLVVAAEGATGAVAGFAYGYKNTADQLWREAVARVVPPQMVAEWLVNAFRFVEIAVAAKAWGQGIGGLLHDHLLKGLPYRKAVLSTMAAETNAFRMYRKRGWQLLAEGIIFPGVARPYLVMGLEWGEGNEGGK
jgi:ribosomal protein S18 acetylase RimI-like enzyme